MSVAAVSKCRLEISEAGFQRIASAEFADCIRRAALRLADVPDGRYALEALIAIWLAGDERGSAVCDAEQLAEFMNSHCETIDALIRKALLKQNSK